MKKWSLLAAFIGFIVGVIGVVVYGTAYVKESTSKIDETKTIHASNINKILLESSLTSVHITKGNNDNITVHLKGRTNTKDFIFIAEANDNTANIEVRYENDTYINLNPFKFISHKLDLTIEVPEKVYEEFQAHSSAGSITIKEISAKQFDLHSSAGSINAEDLKGNFTAESSAGSMKLINVVGKLDLSDSAGSIEIELEDILHDIQASSSAGSVKIVTEKEPKALQLDLHTSAGSVDISYPNANYTTKENDNVVGSIGSGGPMVKLDSSAGSVSIKKK